MSSPATTHGGPLTTIFTPPPGCFADLLPRTWSTCTKDWDSPGLFTCFWSELQECYPTGASTEIVYLAAETGTWASVQRFHYTPAVLPDGFSAVQTTVQALSTTAAGCLSGWTAEGEAWCSTQVTAVQINQGGLETGTFPVILPQISVTWASSELPLFTPASAPALMLEADGLVKQTAPPQPARPSNATSAANEHTSGIPIGAKAGIGVGVGVAVLLTIALVIFILYKKWRAKQQQNSILRAGSPHSIESRRPYVDSKAELTAVHIVELPDKHRQELGVDGEIREMDTYWTPRELGETQQSQELPSEEPLSPPLEPVSPVGTLSPVRTLSSTLPFSPIDLPQELAADDINSTKR